MRKLIANTILALSLSTAAAQGVAATRYITDQLWVPLRSGAGSQYRIINRGIRSGTSLELLQQSDDSKWSQIRTGSGTTGWLPSQYLVEHPAAADRLAAVQKELDTLKETRDAAGNSLASLQAGNEELSQQVTMLTQQKTELESELARIKHTAADALNLEKHNQELLIENEQLKNEADEAQIQIQSLSSSNETRKWMVGAVIMLIGLILGLILPRLNSGRRRDGWN